MRRLLFLIPLFCIQTLTAASPLIPMEDNHKIGVQNSILAKVNGTTISMMDVKKKMDLLFHQNYPQLIQSNQARFQFYETSWRHVLMEMIDNELILADAADKEIKLTDAEVREEIENRFGPSVMATLDKIGISYEETWKLIKNELIVRRMTWWFIHSKALSKVTPQEIRQAYRHYLNEHPSYFDLKYQVLTLRGDQLDAVSEELFAQVQDSKQTPEQLAAILKEFENSHPGVSITVSNEYNVKDNELSELHKSALATIDPGQYSKPVSHVGRDKKEVCRMFYLSERIEHSAPAFEEISPVLKNELLQKSSAEVSQVYIDKLRKHYRFDPSHLKEVLPDDMQPFAIQ